MAITALNSDTQRTLRRNLLPNAQQGNNLTGFLTSVQTRIQTIEAATGVQRLSLQDFKLPATLLQLAASPGSSILGLTSGTHGSASPVLTGNGANNNSKSDSARILVSLSPFYTAGATVTLRVRCKISAAAATAQTIDALVFKSDLAAGVSSDLCTTSAQTITTSYANYDFTIDPTTLSPADTLDVLITALSNDTGGSGTCTITISNVELRYGGVSMV